ncbi:MAG: helix-turn-helix transcriptional regulator [Schwartzia sp.]|nr:helix-turn-helix transcriptional regulator [Schwartzia sp. (in: firmicutes)]
MSNKQIGERIADLRTDNDMQQGELANILGIDRSALSRIEKGHRSIREDELLCIARHFRVTTDYLLGNEPPLQTGTETYYTHREKEHLRKYRAISRENQNLFDALLDSFYRSLSTDDEKR